MVVDHEGVRVAEGPVPVRVAVRLGPLPALVRVVVVLVPVPTAERVRQDVQENIAKQPAARKAKQQRLRRAHIFSRLRFGHEKHDGERQERRAQVASSCDCSAEPESGAGVVRPISEGGVCAVADEISAQVASASQGEAKRIGSSM